MGTDINPVLQRRNPGGGWTDIALDGFFATRSYALFGWLAGVRNHSAVTPISLPRGLPDDFPYDERVGEHDFSWIALDELTAVDYDRIVEDRRTTFIDENGIRDGGGTCPPGHGKQLSLRDFLGQAYFADLARARAAGVERLVFGFDS